MGSIGGVSRGREIMEKDSKCPRIVDVRESEEDKSIPRTLEVPPLGY